MNTHEIVAANIRARLGWLNMTVPVLAEKVGWKYRAANYKVMAISKISADELARVAQALETVPGVFFEVPPGFPPPPSASTR